MAQERSVSLSNIADGAIDEQFHIEFQKVLRNIADPNTSEEKVRTITITLNFKPSQERDFATLDTSVTSKLAPARSIPSTILIDAVGSSVSATELVRKQESLNFEQVEA